MKLGGVLGILQRDPEIFLKSGSHLNETWIDEMIQKRKNARKNSDFSEADRIRNVLIDQGIILQDTFEGITWRIKR